MKRENWNTLGNIFEVKTRKSFKKAFNFADKHFTSLQGQTGDAYVVNVYNSFVTPFDNFHQAFTRWKVHNGLLAGAVQDLEETMLDINRKLKEWEGKIHSLYPEGSEQDAALFPRKRTPFYRGNYTLRTAAVKVLATTLQEYPALAAVKSDVETYHALLDGKLNHKIGLDGLVGKYSKELEAQRKAVMTAMYGNLGLLMFHYRERTAMLKVYFDMGILKNKVRRKRKEKEEEEV